MRINGATVYYRQRELSRLDMDNLGSTPYPFLWWLPQNRTERILVDRLQELDGAVEFERELIDFEQVDDAVRATVVDAAGGGDETDSITANWLIGCDGAHSQVRDTLGRKLQGETLEQEMLVADVIADWQRPANEGALWLHEEGILAALPMLGENEWRLFVDVSPTPPDQRPEATRDVLQRLVRQRTNDDVTIHDAPWTSNFVTNQRMVSGYRSGRVFLAGDAAHVHSPLGGQGMNLGIQDAYNLAWKLALVCEERAATELLDTYGEERLPVAEGVLSETGISGSLLITANPAVRVLRDTVLPVVLDSAWLQSRLFQTMSQLDIGYGESSLSAVALDSALAELRGPSWSDAVRRARQAWDAPRAGDRAPDGQCRHPDSGRTSLYEQFHSSTGFSLLLFAGTEDIGTSELSHIVDTVDEHATDLVQTYHIIREKSQIVDVEHPVTVLRDTEDALHTQYNGAVTPLYLIRPDDYIGLRGRPARADSIVTYLDNNLS